MSMLGDLGIQAQGEVKSDSTAAIGIVCRTGLGRTRHINVQYLWLQEKVLNEELEIRKVGTLLNVADLMTKSLKREDRDRLLELMGMSIVQGRSDASLAINGMHQGDSWAKRQVEERRKENPANKIDRNKVEEKRVEIMRIVVDKNIGEELLGKIVQGNCWVRLHNSKRKALFTPLKVAGGPKDVL